MPRQYEIFRLAAGLNGEGPTYVVAGASLAERGVWDVITTYPNLELARSYVREVVRRQRELENELEDER